MVFVVGVHRFAFLADIANIRRCFGLLDLQSFQLVVFKEVGQTVLCENDSFYKCFYVQLLQDFLPAVNDKCCIRPVWSFADFLEKVVKVELAEGK